MKKYLLVIISLLFLLSISNAQNKKKCNKIFKKHISINYIENSSQEFYDDIQIFLRCNFDSIDSQIIMGPKGDASLIAMSIVSLEKNTKKDFTYRDLYEFIVELKKSEEYRTIRKVVTAKDILFKKEAFLKNWDIDKNLLKQMNFNDTQIVEIYEIVKNNENKKYSEIFQIYSNNIKEEERKNTIEKTNELLKKKQENPELEKFIGNMLVYADYDIGLQKAKEVNKYILVYFNGYGCVNAREMESEILLNPEIQKYINDSLVFINLFVDERTKLNEDEKYFSDVLDKEVKTIGDKRFEIEVKYYKCNFQPFFVLLDSDGKEITRIAYTLNIKKFEAFLKKNKAQ